MSPSSAADAIALFPPHWAATTISTVALAIMGDSNKVSPVATQQPDLPSTEGKTNCEEKRLEGFKQIFKIDYLWFLVVGDGGSHYRRGRKQQKKRS